MTQSLHELMAAAAERLNTAQAENFPVTLTLLRHRHDVVAFLHEVRHEDPPVSGSVVFGRVYYDDGAKVGDLIALGTPIPGETILARVRFVRVTEVGAVDGVKSCAYTEEVPAFFLKVQSFF